MKGREASFGWTLAHPTAITMSTPRPASARPHVAKKKNYSSIEIQKIAESDFQFIISPPQPPPNVGKTQRSAKQPSRVVLHDTPLAAPLEVRRPHSAPRPASPTGSRPHSASPRAASPTTTSARAVGEAYKDPRPMGLTVVGSTGESNAAAVSPRQLYREPQQPRLVWPPNKPPTLEQMERDLEKSTREADALFMGEEAGSITSFFGKSTAKKKKGSRARTRR